MFSRCIRLHLSANSGSYSTNFTWRERWEHDMEIWELVCLKAFMSRVQSISFGFTLLIMCLTCVKLIWNPQFNVHTITFNMVTIILTWFRSLWRIETGSLARYRSGLSTIHLQPLLSVTSTIKTSDLYLLAATHAQDTTSSMFCRCGLLSSHFCGKC